MNSLAAICSPSTWRQRYPHAVDKQLLALSTYWAGIPTDARGPQWSAWFDSDPDAALFLNDGLDYIATFGYAGYFPLLTSVLDRWPAALFNNRKFVGLFKSHAEEIPSSAWVDFARNNFSAAHALTTCYRKHHQSNWFFDYPGSIAMFVPLDKTRANLLMPRDWEYNNYMQQHVLPLIFRHTNTAIWDGYVECHADYRFHAMLYANAFGASMDPDRLSSWITSTFHSDELQVVNAYCRLKAIPFIGVAHTTPIWEKRIQLWESLLPTPANLDAFLDTVQTLDAPSPSAAALPELGITP